MKSVMKRLSKKNVKRLNQGYIKGHYLLKKLHKFLRNSDEDIKKGCSYKKTCIMKVPREKLSQRKKIFRKNCSPVRVFFDSKAM